jgi:uncharacterized BrkB/YihY/UPF0761 family membrane protein
MDLILTILYWVLVTVLLIGAAAVVSIIAYIVYIFFSVFHDEAQKRKGR